MKPQALHCATCRPIRLTLIRFAAQAQIESAFAKLKAILRKVAAHTIDDLWNAIRDALPAFDQRECRNYFTAAGYEPE